MMNEFMEQLVGKAKQNPQRVAFPEAGNVEILKTAQQVVKSGVGFPTLVGNPEAIEKLAGENGIDTEGFLYFDYTDEETRNQLAAEYTSQYQNYSLKAVLRRCADPVYCAMFLLKLHKTDCVAAGKEYTTGDVILDAMSIIGLQDGVQNASSLGILDIPGFEGPQGQMLGVADCAITAQPDAKGLAGIAIASADTVSTLLGWEPRVALLSFSTCGSAEHESLEVIKEAVELVRQTRPGLKVDGEFQLDSAILPQVAEKKVPRESEVAGKANILVFPNLHAGNIGVKLIQIFGKANGYGPILQGFAQPVCDFSRSAKAEDMFGNVVMLIIRAGAMKE